MITFEELYRRSGQPLSCPADRYEKAKDTSSVLSIPYSETPSEPMAFAFYLTLLGYNTLFVSDGIMTVEGFKIGEFIYSIGGRTNRIDKAFAQFESTIVGSDGTDPKLISIDPYSAEINLDSMKGFDRAVLYLRSRYLEDMLIAAKDTVCKELIIIPRYDSDFNIVI